MNVNFATAVLASQVGFDGASFEYYDNEGFLKSFRDSGGIAPQKRLKRLLIYIAPTQSQLQTWLRDQGVMIEVNFYTYLDNIEYLVEVCHKDTWHEKTEFRRDTFPTYEKALEKGLFQGLKILNKQKENKDGSKTNNSGKRQAV